MTRKIAYNALRSLDPTKEFIDEKAYGFCHRFACDNCLC